METSKEISSEFVVCINNENYPASLELHKIYRLIPDEDAVAEGDMRIIDEYRGKDVPEGYTVFTLRIFYQSFDRTLTSQEVDAFHNSIREHLSQKEGMRLR